MYPASFEYHRPNDLSAALRLIETLGEDAKCLAGGHSLIPAMKLRLVQPAHLIDLGKVEALRGISLEGDELVIGAMTTHWQVESSRIVQQELPSLAGAASVIADPQVRNRGTIGGSLAYADPAADYPANMLALDWTMVCTSLAGTRHIPADEWFISLLTTSLRPNEILTQIRIPLPKGRTAARYVKVPHPASRLAMVGVAVLVTVGENRSCTLIRIGITGPCETAQRGFAAEAALKGTALTHMEIDAAARALSDSLDIQGDLILDEEAKRHLCALTVARAVREAAALACA
ncbi:xanthine dehydrogenase family protein subunit M [Bradyrhizobium tropiciagri]|uniref:FAD binding domain-containing protein n=1 Tax=Bradyrhizobium tropiciagri TaxID=312253 RepID=UPI001BAA324D|nr:xanthine dehydrogenase family protein subunit M [Bradyrhizobium tropiciagri]MBR0898905.1 xanthine dehydrogenase family protein subunit M [Bradyrhizobium tropiciagri]